jgi:hypothetical protein
MAQNALTVTPPNPTPPTNFSFTGATPPNPPNYTKLTMADSKNWGPGSGTVYAPTNPPPYFDDGTAASLLVYAANTAALASGSGATAGGTDGTYPGTGTGINMQGAVPASSSVAHEGAGSELSVTAPGSVAACPTVAVSCLGNYTNLVSNNPNTQHASSLNAAGTSTISSLSAGGASGPGTTLLTVTGTNFRRDSIVTVNGIPQNTNYVSATSLTVINAPKKATAGNLPVTVTTGGVTTAPTNWVFT